MQPSQLLLLAVLTAAACAARPAAPVSLAPRAPADRHAQVDALFEPWNRPTTPGCAVGIAQHGVVDYVRGYGMADLEHAVPITPTSIFHAASIAKQFTALAIGLLAQDGTLSLTDDIRTYLPELPDYGKPITVSHLLHHTSGLREQGVLLALAGWRDDDVMATDDVLWVAAKQRGLNFQPGTEALYNNMGYTLLAEIVKRASGQTLRQLAAERIFKPLAMNDTHFHVDHTELVPGRTSAYRLGPDGQWRISIPVFDHYGSTSLFTTVGDLLKWEQNFDHPRVGGKALVDWMRTPGTLNDGTSTGYAKGRRVETHRGLRSEGHQGIDAGYRADLVTFPDQQLTVVALCNAATASPHELTRKIAALYLGDRLAKTTVPATAVPEAEQRQFSGTYWSSHSDEVVQVEWRDGALRRRGAPPALEVLVPLGEGEFRAGDDVEHWSFTTPADEAPREVRIFDYWPQPRVFQQVTLPRPATSDLSAFVGEYRIDEIDATFTVRLNGDTLSLHWPRQMQLPLEPVGGDRFVGGPLGTVTFTRNSAGAINGFTISHRRLRRLTAKRIANRDSHSLESRHAPLDRAAPTTGLAETGTA